MRRPREKSAIALVLLLIAVLGCKSLGNKNTSTTSNSGDSSSSNSSSSSGKPDDKGLIHSGTGTEMVSPPAGTGRWLIVQDQKLVGRDFHGQD